MTRTVVLLHSSIVCIRVLILTCWTVSDVRRGNTSLPSLPLRQEVTPAGCGEGQGGWGAGRASSTAIQPPPVPSRLGWWLVPHNHHHPDTLTPCSHQFLDPARLSMFVPGLARDRKLCQPSLLQFGNIIFSWEFSKYFQFGILEIIGVGQPSPC